MDAVAAALTAGETVPVRGRFYRPEVEFGNSVEFAYVRLLLSDLTMCRNGPESHRGNVTARKRSKPAKPERVPHKTPVRGRRA